jgi:hypothetical protein
MEKDEINFLMELVPDPTIIGFNQNYQNKFNIHSPTHPGVVHIKTNTQVT